MKRNANDKLMDVSKELAVLMNESKYGLSFYYSGRTMKLTDRLGDNQIGVRSLKPPQQQKGEDPKY